ncbi:hypothetical protein TPHA_0C00450 [Tetrapisispora phaffii CBS 4417]|uniref:Uncharacterized protein n=1 Tax=Tetrapisispora phaffii (strain ATCC 24235 / CBS 4417 / NBRC 1672 / NRRL Y-8282 / UCD 70-5) TaxID=1071381 RepID=G8BR26_TETPH|nr:hypothetical protein TPHA_0C00450 [Tetrapisispora phaffii CBS 4417]CCE62202.1 hypothetical protein TPHA_0C00450 [Tetrapisispora phaffii CBS 4417]
MGDSDAVKQMRDAYSQLKIYSDSLNDYSGSIDATQSVSSNDDGKRMQTGGTESQQESRIPTLSPSVSFNTVPSFTDNSHFQTEEPEFLGVQIPDAYTMDEYYDNESYQPESHLKQGQHDYTTHSSHNRSSSFPPGWISPKTRMAANNLSHHLKISENGKIVRTDYPSRPSVSTDSVIINREQNMFKKAWRTRKNRIGHRRCNKSIYFKKPDILFPEEQYTMAVMGNDYTPITKQQRKKDKILQKKVGFTNGPRTIICHISGRKYTWVALDWILKELSNNDHLVVIANLPKIKLPGRNHGDKFNKFVGDITSDAASSSSRASSDNTKKDLFSLFSSPLTNNATEWCYGYEKIDIENSIRNIFTYITSIISPSLSVKITVEINVDKTSSTLIDVFKSYNPDFIVAGTKKWKLTEDLVCWKSRYVSDQLATRYIVPVFLVPSLRMHEFERSIQNENSGPVKNNSELNLLVESAVKKKQDKSNTDDSITNRIEHEITSKTMEQQLKLLSMDNRNNMLENLKKCEINNHNDPLCKINIIFNASVSFAKSIAQIKVDCSVVSEFERWKKEITGGEVKPETTSKKSMLDVVNTTSKTKAPKLHHTHTHSGIVRTLSHQPRQPLTRQLSSSPTRSNLDDLPSISHVLTYSGNSPGHTHDSHRKIKKDTEGPVLRKVVSNTESPPKKKSGGFFSSLFKK